jgi:alkylation response protein AidB-like acyl-CoA dehydrogenase
MDLFPTKRQQDLRDGLTALFGPRGTPQWEATVSSAPGYDRGLWSDLMAGGWVTAGFPEALGGQGGGLGDVVVVAGTLGAGPVPTPFLGGIVLCGQALLAVADQGDRLRALLSGERTFTYCNWEGFDTPAERQSTVEATEATNGWRLDGVARFVPYRSDADE